MRTTEKRLRAARWLTGAGIEIGALHNPLPVPPGTAVRYVDRLSVEELREHYPELDAEALVPVDISGDAEDLSTLADASQDFVIANHLLEHLENPLRGLEEMTRVLRPGGILYLALPDPRLTFDRDRELTSVDHVVADYRGATKATREAHYVEWVERAEPLVDFLVATGAPTGEPRVRELMAKSYSIHFHVWRPDTFLGVLLAARQEAGVLLEPLEFSGSRAGEDDEFIFVLAKGADGLPPLPPPAGDSGLEHHNQRLAELEAEVAALLPDHAKLEQLRRLVRRLPAGGWLARRAARLLLRPPSAPSPPKPQRHSEFLKFRRHPRRRK